MKISLKTIGVREPKPRVVALPSKEPLCTIGVVLAEDKKRSLKVKVDDKGYCFWVDGLSIPLTPKTEYLIEIKQSALHLTQGHKPLIFAKRVELLAPRAKKFKLAPQKGILVDSLVAGRGFHWQKEVQQILPGDLVFHLEGRHMVVVNLVPMEAYLACVITSEMGVKCPPEFIKAQAVAARSWSMAFLGYKHINQPFSICNDDCCQRYQGTTFLTEKTIKAVEAARGQFLSAGDDLVCASFYSKSCGGYMECATDIFGFDAPGTTPKPDCLKSHPESFCSTKSVKESALSQYLGKVDSKGHYFRWQYKVTAKELIKILEKKVKLKVKQIDSLMALKRSPSGRVTKLRLDYLDSRGKQASVEFDSQYVIRFALHEKFMYSSAFVINPKRARTGHITELTFSGAGWGHGVGLCQIGALGMALDGYSYKEILGHYYDKAKLKKCY